MKVLAILLVMALAAVEGYPHSETIQLCGADLHRGLTIACRSGNNDLLNLKQVQYHHQPDQHHEHQSDHHYDHQHEHQHDNQHHHQHDNQSTNPKSHATKSIVEECCQKPCHIKDFISYCPSN